MKGMANFSLQRMDCCTALGNDDCHLLAACHPVKNHQWDELQAIRGADEAAGSRSVCFGGAADGTCYTSNM